MRTCVRRDPWARIGSYNYGGERVPRRAVRKLETQERPCVVLVQAEGLRTRRSEGLSPSLKATGLEA